MGFRRVVIAFAVAWLWAGGVSAQKRPYNLIMKDVASSFDGLRKHLEGDALPAAAAEARRLEALFKETEDFWAPFRTKDAIDAARGAREAAAASASAATAKDAAKAKTAASGVGRFCTACHNSHREQMPDKSYRIRP